MSFLAEYGPWSWIVAGLVLLALELLVPGGYLLWMGIAGILTGLITLFQQPPLPVQWLIFGTLSLVSILAWMRLMRGRKQQSDRPLLNQRTEHFLGQEAVLDQPIAGGFGRLALGDTIWRISGPDLPAGQRIRIVGAEGGVAGGAGLKARAQIFLNHKLQRSAQPPMGIGPPWADPSTEPSFARATPDIAARARYGPGAHGRPRRTAGAEQLQYRQ